MSKATTLKGIEYLEEEGYEVLPHTHNAYEFVEAIKEGISYKVSIRKVPMKYTEYRFRHQDSQRYHEEGIKQLWVLDEQVGWNRDYFKLDRKF